MKLSTLQYRNTVRDLLEASGLAAVAAELTTELAAVPDDSTIAFRGLDRRVTSEHLNAYFKLATSIGDAATKNTERLTALAGSCATSDSLSAKCLDDFLKQFGRRAFRRPLTNDELTEFRDVAQGSSPKAASSAEALRNTLVVLLLSPRFLNHLELEGAAVDQRSDYFKLNAFEIASRLSYTFWQTLPDDALLDDAASGKLDTDAGFEAALDRVFADPRTQRTIWQFWNEWMHFESFTGFVSERPAFQAFAKGEHIGESGHDHWGDMVQEVRDLTELYTWKQPGSFNQLLTSTASVTRSADLARLYGVTAWKGTGAYPALPEGTRMGLLQRAALLASSLETTNPFHRGSMIRRSLLCDNLPRPDPTSLPPGSLDAPPPSQALTTRARYQKKVEGNALCAGCHSAFSDLGYVMEAFDSLGRYRTEERIFDEQTGALLATLPLDTSAKIGLVGPAVAIANPIELNQAIVASGKVEACLSANYFRYALRRDPTKDSQDACAFDGMRKSLLDPNAQLSDVFRSIATASGFRMRKMEKP